MVAGVSGGALSSRSVIILGAALATSAADGLSMGVGNYLSIRSHKSARAAQGLMSQPPGTALRRCWRPSPGASVPLRAHCPAAESGPRRVGVHHLHVYRVVRCRRAALTRHHRSVVDRRPRDARAAGRGTGGVHRRGACRTEPMSLRWDDDARTAGGHVHIRRICTRGECCCQDQGGIQRAKRASGGPARGRPFADPGTACLFGRCCLRRELKSPDCRGDISAAARLVEFGPPTGSSP